MPASPPDAADLAQRLLDAQVRHHLDRLTGPDAADTLLALTDDLLAALDDRPIRDLIDPDDITDVVVGSLATVPGSEAVSTIVELATEVALAAPVSPYPLGEVVERAQVEALLDALLAQTPSLERALDRLTATPLAGVMATRFLGRVVAVAMETNRSMADKLVPGLGSLMAFGTSTATRVVGAADTQLQGLLGDTVGRGGSFAVGRLNRMIVETLRDPTTREAVLQAWDQLAGRPLGGLGERDEVLEVVRAGHDLTVTVLAHPYVGQLTAAMVAAFFDRFGDHSPTRLLDELGIPRAYLARFSPGVLTALHDSGHLERLIRTHLEPFYASAEVRSLLG